MSVLLGANLATAILLADTTGTQVMAVVLWSGLGILTVALLVLTRTRWGQAKPISKCVALSVFAHVWLMGYAYGTNLFVDSPPAANRANDTKIKVVSTVETEQSQPNDRLDKSWEKLTADTVAGPNVFSPPRRDTPVTSQADDPPAPRPSTGGNPLPHTVPEELAHNEREEKPAEAIPEQD